MLWLIGIGLVVAWILGVIVHVGGWVHLLLLSGLSVLLIQVMAYRKTKFSQKNKT
jgi:hypothetical protein